MIFKVRHLLTDQLLQMISVIEPELHRSIHGNLSKVTGGQFKKIKRAYELQDSEGFALLASRRKHFYQLLRLEIVSLAVGFVAVYLML